MKKLVIDARTINNSGIGVYLKRVLPFILDFGRFHVSLLCRREDRKNMQWNDVEDVSCEAPIYSIQEQFEVAWKVPSCDIFWSPHYNVPLLPIRARKRIVTIHDVYHLAYWKNLRPVERLYAGVVFPMATRLSHRIITVSEFSKNEIVHYTHSNSGKIEVIHNGVNADWFRAASRNTALLARYGLGDYLLFVGNVKPHKNIAGLIEAFGMLRTRYPQLKLLVVGQKDKFITGINGLEEHLRAVGLADAVVFTGFVTDDELRSLYKGARMLVFPSFYEGFGLPPLEAMAAGIPVVASRAASIPEVCGDAALYVDPGSPRDMAVGMGKILEDETLGKRLVAAGNIRVGLFSWQAAAQRHIQVLSAL